MHKTTQDLSSVSETKRLIVGAEEYIYCLSHPLSETLINILYLAKLNDKSVFKVIKKARGHFKEMQTENRVL